MQNRNWLYQVAAALTLVAALVLVHPNVEAGMNDDWSFIFTVRDLAASGHLRYNGWAAPLIGFQAYWAALFVKLFGFSFLTVRASVWVLAILAIPVLWRLLRLADLSQQQAFLGLLFFLLSPLVLPNVSTFMTDMPAFWLFAATILCALKAWKSTSEKTALLWMAATSGAAILSGSIRQIYWLAGVCCLVALGLLRIRSIRSRAFVMLLVACIVAFGTAGSYWLAQQPYVPADNMLRGLRESSGLQILQTAGGDSLRNLIGVSVLCLPLTLPLVWQRARRLPWWSVILIFVAGILVPYWLANPLPWLGNTLTNYGVIMSGTLSLGDKPVILSNGLIWLLALAGIVSAIYTLVLAAGRPGPFALLTLPFLLLYTLVIAIRACGFGLYDRYIIPHVFIFSVLALRSSPKISRVTWVLGGIFALYAIATTHDYFAEARAKLQAANEILRAGYDRASILGGFEFDAWTQLEKSGHVNNSLVRYPSDAYHEMDDCTGPDDAQAWWRSMEPALAARYVVTLTPIADLQPTAFPPVEYKRWLPLGSYQVYVETIARQAPLLTCSPQREDKAY